MRIIKKSLIILIISFVLFVIATILISRKHPIFKKWAVGWARCVGRPIKAKIYTDGKLNKEVTLYHVDKYFHGEKADYFIIILPITDPGMYRNIFFLDRMHDLAGIANSTNIADYDHLFGYLFQSDMGAEYSQFNDDMKGFNFEPKLVFNKNTITFNMPQRSETYKCDSVRIELLNTNTQ